MVSVETVVVLPSELTSVLSIVGIGVITGSTGWGVGRGVGRGVGGGEGGKHTGSQTAGHAS